MINNEKVLERFFDYIKIDSETGFEKEMGERLVKDFTELGMEVYADNIGTKIDSTGTNVYAFLKGDESKETMLFSAHMDTVVPGKNIEPIIEDGYIKSKGETILGGDDKSGIVAIVEAIRTIKENNLENRPVEVLITIREESGLKGSKNADYSRLKAKKAVVLDSSGDVGKVMLSAPGQLSINAEFIGKKAHAGVAPEEGISAIAVAAKAISNMKLLRIDEETTANIGVLKSEYPTNIVPDSCVLVAEARSRNNDKLIAQGEHMRACMEDACKEYGATLNCKIETSYESYKVDENSELPQFIKAKFAEAGITTVFGSSGGGSDANIFAKNGIESVVLATGMDKVHTTNEQITVENLNNIAKVTLALML